MRAASQEAPRWFLTDRPINAASQDQFSHADVADNLYTMINGAQRDERLMIGLLGPFGVGKSTVVQLLSEKMNSKATAVVRVSAERHEQPGLHASLIFAFAEELVDKANVSKQLVEDELAALKYASAQTRVDPTATGISQLPATARRIAASRRWVLPSLLGLLTLLIIATVVVWWTVGSTVISQTMAALSVLGVAAYAAVPAFAVTGLSKWAQELIKPGSTTLTRPRVQSADEFERAFAALVKVATQDGKKKLVIAVDDIDRLSPAEVLTGLNAIRSFQLTCDHNERPVFIVSADEDIIESAIRRSNPGPAAGSAGRGETARAFVDRLFTHRQEMPVHAEADLTSYALTLLAGNHAGAKALGDETAAAVEVLIHDGVQDPRHVIRLLNAFFGDYRLALGREAQSGTSHAIRSGTVTGEPLTLARMTVLKLDFPKFHKALFDDDDLLGKLERDISGDEMMSDTDKIFTGYVTQSEVDRLKPSVNDNAAVNAQVAQRSEWAALRSFIGRTTRIRPVDDLRPFLYLGQGEIDRVIGGREARSIRNNLINGQVADLRNQLNAIGETPDSAERLDAITRVITATIDQRSGLERTNAVETITRNLDAMPDHGIPKIAVAIATALRTGTLTPQETGPLLHLAAAAGERHDKVMLAQHVLTPLGESTTSRDMVILRGRVSLSQILESDSVKSRLLDRIDSIHDASRETIGEWLRTWEATPSPDLAGPFLVAILTALAEPADDVPADWRGPILSCFIQAAEDGDSQKQIQQRSVAILDGGLNTNIASIIIEGLRRLPPPPDELLLQAIYTGTVAQDDAVLDDISDTTWKHALAITTRELHGLNSEKSALEAGEILDAYLVRHQGQEPPAEAAELLGLVTQVSDAAGNTPMATLLEGWTFAATNGEEFELGPVFDGLDPSATTTADLVGPVLSSALTPTGPEPLREAAKHTFAPLSANAAGQRILTDVLTMQRDQVQYNLPGLGQVGDYIIAIYSLPSYTPPQQVTTDLVERCRQQVVYGTGQQELLTILSEVPWPPAAIGQVVDVLESQASALTNDHRWGLLSQLAAHEFPIPSTLRSMLMDAIVTEGDGEARHLVAVRAAAHLSVADAVSVALRLDHGPQVIDELSDAADTGAAFGDAVATMINNPERNGMPASVHTLRACADKSPHSWAAQMETLAITEIEGDPRAPLSVWRDLINAATGPSESVIFQRASAALDDTPPNSSEFVKAAITSRDDVQQGCVDRMLQASTDHDEERTKDLARLLTITPDARSRAIDALKGKRTAAAKAAKVVLGQPED